MPMRSRLNSPSPPAPNYECKGCGVRMNGQGDCDCVPEIVPFLGEVTDA